MKSKTIKKLATIVLALVALSWPSQAHGQFGNYDWSNQIIDHTKKRNQLVRKYNDMHEKSRKAWDAGKYQESLYYLKKCKEINDSFDQDICDVAKLNKSIKDCEDYINRLKKEQEEAEKKEKLRQYNDQGRKH